MLALLLTACQAAPPPSVQIEVAPQAAAAPEAIYPMAVLPLQVEGTIARENKLGERLAAALARRMDPTARPVSADAPPPGMTLDAEAARRSGATSILRGRIHCPAHPDAPGLTALVELALVAADDGRPLATLQVDVALPLGDPRALREAVLADLPGSQLAGWLRADPSAVPPAGTEPLLTALVEHVVAAHVDRPLRVRRDRVTVDLLRGDAAGARGLELLVAGLPELAAAALEDATARGDDGRSWYNLGVARELLGRREAARGAYLRARDRLDAEPLVEAALTRISN